MLVKEITAQETHSVRHRVLRQNQPLSACIYPHDEDSDTFHIGAFDSDKVVSIVSFYKENSDSFNERNQFRFRGMATLPEFRSKGYGSALIEKAIEILKSKNCELMWCNARIIALPYYLKLGFKDLPEIFEIEGIGPHKVMFKTI